MVHELEEWSAIRSGPVRDAFLATPRERFIPDVLETRGIRAVYRNEAFPTMTDSVGNPISSSSEPGVMASMLEEMRLEPGHRVLEIGTGTGYNAALLSHIVGSRGRVTSIELHPHAAAAARTALTGSRVRVATGDGRHGWPRTSPYDRIIATASSLDVPRALLDQLVDDGLLVLPLRLTDALPFRQIIVTLERKGNEFSSRSVTRGGFMRLRDHPDDPSLPWPELRAEETPDADAPATAIISGSSLGTLSSEARTRLLRTMLRSSRTRPLGIRATYWRQYELEAFIALAAPEDRLVGYVREDLEPLLFISSALPGIIERDGSSLAHVSGRKSMSRIEVYGRASSGSLLASIVDGWKRRGRPGVDRLRIHVTYGTRRNSTAWRTKRRGQSTISFDWRDAHPTGPRARVSPPETR
ncbi:MAG: protein-L-isoaspartate O-methyltransferase family protein [Actinomycetota bacterium]